MPVTVAKWLANLTAWQEVCGSNPNILPLWKLAYGEGDWLLC